MRILHYALGFPPYRSGGLTKFCMDLMKQQAKDGHQVALLWPGQMGFIEKKNKVKDKGYEEFSGLRIHSFEVVNPIPVSFDEGISDFQAFTNEGDKSVYIEFLEKNKPDVIHVHTLMGLHKAFIVAAKEKDIRLVFTAHDFFPICSKVTMFRHSEICKSVEDCSECGVCNVTALGMRKMQILQSPIYRQLKDVAIVEKFRKQHRDSYLSESSVAIGKNPVGSADDFKQLRAYFKSMLALMDIIHYNSTLTKEVYEKFIGEFSNAVIGITHDNIADHRKMKSFNDEKIKMRFLGPYGGGKGFFISRRHLISFGTSEKILA